MTGSASFHRTVPVDGPMDLRRTLAPLRHGPLDPTSRSDASGVWRATRTPEGPATIHFATDPGGVAVRAWGPGADWVLDRSPAMLGAGDRPEDFQPDHAGIRDLHRRYAGIRFGRSEAVFEALVPEILGQRVTGQEAGRSWRQLVRAHSEPAPGPAGLVLPPAPQTLRALGYYDFHPLGVERVRAMTVLRVADLAPKLQKIVGGPLADAYRLLTAIPGIGPWTAARAGAVALGDVDAVPVGDLHLPHLVSWALAGEPRADDDRMLELLEPFRGHRGRVVRLLTIAGPRPERRGPRYRPIPIARL